MGIESTSDRAGTGAARLVACLLVGCVLGSGPLAQDVPLRGYAVLPGGEVPEDFVIRDLNADGLPDLVVANTRAYQPAGIATESVSVYINSAGGFLSPKEYPVGDRPEGIVVADFNRDGAQDVATADYHGNSVSLLLGVVDAGTGRPNGTFTAGARVSVAGGPRGIAAADLDADGNLDLVTANYKTDSVTVLRGGGDARFSVLATYAVGGEPEVVVTGSFDLDGIPDVATCDVASDTVTLLRGTGGGGLALHQVVPVGRQPRHVRAVNLDGGGADELVVCNHLSHTVAVLARGADGAFAVRTLLDAPGIKGPLSTAAGDLDLDGRLDLVVAFARDDAVVAYRRASGLDFGAGVVLPAGDNVVGVGVADLDRDGRQDVVLTNALDHSLFVYYGEATTARVVVDNGAAGTLALGSWYPSGGVLPFGAGSLYSKASGTAYRWSRGVPTRRYATYAWWSYLSNRSQAVSYTVQHDETPFTSTVVVSQRQNAGHWNHLGDYRFRGIGIVDVASRSSTETTCADAVSFVPLLVDSIPPGVTIETAPTSPVERGSAAVFGARGADADGSILRYDWTSSLDGFLSLEASFSTTRLSVGVHEISVRAQDDKGYWSRRAAVEVVVEESPAAGYTYVLDNGDEGTSSVGVWSRSSGPRPFGVDSLYAREGSTYTYAFDLATSGYYEVYAWWTEWTSRSTSVPYEIEHREGVSVARVSQASNGGTWRYLGTFAFDTRGRITVRAQGYATTCADAVALNYVPPGDNRPPVAEIEDVSPNPVSEGTDVVFVGRGRDPDGDPVARYRWESSVVGFLSEEPVFAMGSLPPGAHTITLRVMDARGLWSEGTTRSLTVQGKVTRVLDNGDAGTSFTGVWSVSGGADAYGGSSLYARGGATYSYRFTGLQGGAYHVFAWWTEWSSRSNRVPYEIRHALGTRTVYADQLQGGGRWNYLGTFIFGLEASVTLRAEGLATSCADAISIVRSDNLAPTAAIVSLAPRSPLFGQEVTFEGQARDTDGSIVAYEWRSDIDGLLGTQSAFSTDALSVGRHEILFRARDNDGEWSNVAWDTVEVRSDKEVILDNGDAGTSATGSWLLSSAPEPFGSTSLYAKGAGSYAYSFTGLVPGRYRVHAWWTAWPSRSTTVTIRIRHSTGSQDVSVNQRTSGGQWNALGEFGFTDSALVTILVDGSDPNASTCADAIRLERVP